jgi:quinone-reactive Ni/Fe-hydrogenase small subunit
MSDRVEAVKKLFTSKSSRVETNKGELYYQELFEKCEARLNEMRSQMPVNKA